MFFPLILCIAISNANEGSCHVIAKVGKFTKRGISIGECNMATPDFDWVAMLDPMLRLTLIFTCFLDIDVEHVRVCVCVCV